MKARWRTLLWLGVWIAAAPSVRAGADDDPARRYERPGPYAVASVTCEWRDAARAREVPVKIYYPKTGKGPFPVIVFSHGLGGMREGYEYLGRHWASHGYVSVHLQHLGSDAAVWKGAAEPVKDMKRAANAANAVARARDVSFAIDRLTEMNRGGPPLGGRLDLERIGVAGHSFGANTALLVAGQATVAPGGRPVAPLADPRVKAAIPMSPPVPARRDLCDRIYSLVKIPCLHMTGTLDTSPIGLTKAEDRRIPFDHIKAADQYLVVFKGGDHMVFSGRGVLTPDRPKDRRFQDFIRAATAAFWDAYLKGDARAREWLAGGGLAKALGGDGSLEERLEAK